MIDPELQIQIITTSIGILNSIEKDRQFFLGPAIVHSISENELTLFVLNTNKEKKESDLPSEAILTMQDISNKVFISIAGVLQLINDSDLANEAWNQKYENWFGADISNRMVDFVKFNITQCNQWTT